MLNCKITNEWMAKTDERRRRQEGDGEKLGYRKIRTVYSASLKCLM